MVNSHYQMSSVEQQILSAKLECFLFKQKNIFQAKKNTKEKRQDF